MVKKNEKKVEDIPIALTFTEDYANIAALTEALGTAYDDASNRFGSMIKAIGLLPEETQVSILKEVIESTEYGTADAFIMYLNNGLTTEVIKKIYESDC